jgi:hypothetical protein
MTTSNTQAKRRLRRLLACTAAGALLTIGASWLTSRRQRWERLPNIVERARAAEQAIAGQFRWPIRPPAGWPLYAGRKSAYSTAGFSESYFLDRGEYAVIRYQSGWPMLSMLCFRIHDPTMIDASHSWEYVLKSGLEFNQSARPRPDPLPLAVILPGFALDTAFHGAIAVTLWSAPGAIRRRPPRPRPLPRLRLRPQRQHERRLPRVRRVHRASDVL